MVVPPRYVKAVSLKNSTAHAVKVTAVFGSDEQEAEGNAKIRETHEIAPHAELKLGEHSYDMGSWTAIAALSALEVEPAAGSTGQLGKTHFTPEVSGIVDVLHVVIDAGATNLTLAAKQQ